MLTMQRIGSILHNLHTRRSDLFRHIVTVDKK
jgi:hypothetical protein